MKLPKSIAFDHVDFDGLRTKFPSFLLLFWKLIIPRSSVRGSVDEEGWGIRFVGHARVIE